MAQERDKLTVAAEGATRLRIKNQEILAKEEQVRALLASNKSKLDNLLGTRGKGLQPGLAEHQRSKLSCHCSACKSRRCCIVIMYFTLHDAAERWGVVQLWCYCAVLCS